MRRYGLVLVVAVALLTRVLYWARLSPDYVPQRDAVHYHEIAARIADGHGLTHQYPQIFMHPTAFRPPLYPYLLGGAYKLFGTDVVVGRVLSLLLGLAVVALAYALVLRMAGWRAALVTGLLVALYPPLVANDTFLLTEPLSLLLLLAMLHLLDRRRWAGAGVACGLLILSRPSAQFIVVVVAVWVLWQLGWKRALWFTGVTALVVAPWVVRNWVELGAPVLVTSNGFNAAASYSPQARETGSFVDAVFDDRFDEYRLSQFDEVEWNNALQELAIETVKDDPGLVPDVVVRNFEQYFELDPGLNVDPETSDGRNLDFRDRTLWSFYVVTLVGLFGLVVRARQPMVLLVLAVAAYFTLSSLVFVAPPRVRAPFDLCCCIGFGLAVDWGWARVRARRGQTGPAGSTVPVGTGGQGGVMGRLDGRVAIVTGAGGGIGREHALLLAAEGAAVVVDDIGTRTGADADAVVADIEAAGGRAVACTASATWDGAAEVVGAAIDAFGRLDIVVNNATAGRNDDLWRFSEQEWDRTLGVNLKGYFAMIREATPHMARQGGGAIVNTSSSSGFGHPSHTAYAAAKEGVVGLTRTAAMELGRFGIRCNAVRPVAITRQVAEYHEQTVRWRRLMDLTMGVSTQAMDAEAFGPARVSPFVVWLCTDAARGVNGRTFFVSGDRVSLFTEPKPQRTITSEGGWTLDELDAVAPEDLVGGMVNRFTLDDHPEMKVFDEEGAP